MATIVGTSAAETLDNNAGVSDTITGLAGNDTFVYTRSGASETDVLTDFGSTYFAATIDASKEVPPNTSTATGTLTAALSRGNAHLSFSLHLDGLDLGGQTGSTSDDVTAAHFHSGASGVSGGVVFGFIGSPNNDTDGDTAVNAAAGNVSGEWDAAEGSGTTLTAQIANLLAGNIYVNFHTTTHSGGAIRGQLLAQDSGLDRLDVRAANIGDWSTMQFLLHDVSGSAQFTTTFDGHTHTMQFSGVSEANLQEADFIFAGNVNETIAGTANADDLFGAGGTDHINGSGGNDRLFGESGKDVLIGGKGHDTLYGGTGADKFTLQTTGESGVGAAKRDIIADFSHGQHDKINLHTIDADSTLGGNQDFFLGGGAFTHTPGELIQVSSGGKTIVSGDVNGDGHADFQIELSGAPTLVNGDFVF